MSLRRTIRRIAEGACIIAMVIPAGWTVLKLIEALTGDFAANIFGAGLVGFAVLGFFEEDKP